MIVRVWTARSTPENAPVYVRHVTESVFPSLSKLAGHRGAYVLQRDVEGGVELVVATLWDSMNAVKRFAGDNPEKAVVEPEARAVLTRYDELVKHFELTYDSSSGHSR